MSPKNYHFIEILNSFGSSGFKHKSEENFNTYLGTLKLIIKRGRTINQGTLNGDFTT
jgi:hypothetical protein